MKAHTIFLEDEQGQTTDKPLAFIHPASRQSVETVLSAAVGSGDGRSEFIWVRLQNGDLILGVFPCGDTYFAVEIDAAGGTGLNG